MAKKDAMLFVDAQNLVHGAQNYAEKEDISDYRIDALALRDVLSEDYQLIRPYWFDSFKPESDDSAKKKFFHMLEMNGFMVQERRLIKKEGEWMEKGLDIDLATEVMVQMFRESYDVAIIVTGDLDFLPSIKRVAEQGKEVVVAGFEENTSWKLMRTADRYVDLSEIAEKIRQTK